MCLPPQYEKNKSSCLGSAHDLLPHRKLYLSLSTRSRSFRISFPLLFAVALKHHHHLRLMYNRRNEREIKNKNGTHDGKPTIYKYAILCGWIHYTIHGNHAELTIWHDWYSIFANSFNTCQMRSCSKLNTNIQCVCMMFFFSSGVYCVGVWLYGTKCGNSQCTLWQNDITANDISSITCPTAINTFL